MNRMSEAPLRIALLVYRGNPTRGGQGVYTRELATRAGRAGPPGHRVRRPAVARARPRASTSCPSRASTSTASPTRSGCPEAVGSSGTSSTSSSSRSCRTGAFPEPLTFSLRVRKLLEPAPRRLRPHPRQPVPRAPASASSSTTAGRSSRPSTTRSPSTAASTSPTPSRSSGSSGLRRWYSFLRMQKRTLQKMPRIVTVSESSQTRHRRTRWACPPSSMHDRARGRRPHELRADPLDRQGPRPHRVHHVVRHAPEGPRAAARGGGQAAHRAPRRASCTSSAAHGRGPPSPGHIERLGLEGAVTFRKGITNREITELYASSRWPCVPSLYEGFSLPAIEAMACAVPLVATTGGALPEVVGPDGGAGVLVPPGDPGALAAAIGRLLDDPAERERLGEAGRARVPGQLHLAALRRGHRRALPLGARPPRPTTATRRRCRRHRRRRRHRRQGRPARC